MFGQSVMTFNMHSLLHLVQSVRMTGPLWSTSTFPFEGAIFYLKRAITGPKGVYDQIAKRTLLKLIFDHTLKILASSETCVNFCENMFSHPDCKNAVKASDQILLLGPLGQSEDGAQLYQRCIFKSSMFHSTKYIRPTKTNDTFIVLTSKEIGEITDFKYKNGTTYVSLHLFSEVPMDLQISHISEIQRTISTITVPLEFIDKKLMYMEVGDSSFVTRLPNTVEIQ